MLLYFVNVLLCFVCWGCLGVLGCLVCLVVAWRCFCFDFDVYLLISFVCLFICFAFVWSCVYLLLGLLVRFGMFC